MQHQGLLAKIGGGCVNHRWKKHKEKGLPPRLQEETSILQSNDFFVSFILLTDYSRKVLIFFLQKHPYYFYSPFPHYDRLLSTTDICGMPIFVALEK